MVQHVGKEPGHVGATRKAEDEDVIVLVASHQELVPTHDMGIERGANSGILGLIIPGV